MRDGGEVAVEVKKSTITGEDENERRRKVGRREGGREVAGGGFGAGAEGRRKTFLPAMRRGLGGF